MTSDDALGICRAVAALSGDPLLERMDNRPFQGWPQLAEAIERVLVDRQIALDEAEEYRKQLREWGIPAKRRTARKLEGKGFELGWAQ